MCVHTCLLNFITGIFFKGILNLLMNFRSNSMVCSPPKGGLRDQTKPEKGGLDTAAQCVVPLGAETVQSKTRGGGCPTQWVCRMPVDEAFDLRGGTLSKDPLPGRSEAVGPGQRHGRRRRCAGPTLSIPAGQVALLSPSPASPPWP